MKKLTLVFLSFLFVSTIVAQPPQKVSYQAVVRDQDNNLIVNQQIGVKLSILETSPNGLPVYAELHQITTNSNELMTLVVGSGTPTPGSIFSDIDWAYQDFYLQTEIDLQGGNQYTIVGTQQLITVPYAFHSGTSTYADSSDFYHLANRPIGSNMGDILYWNDQTNEWSVLPIGQQGQVLSVHNGNLFWVNSTIVNNSPPTIITDTIFDITGRTAKVRATITDVGSSDIIASGVCWSTTPNPSIGNSYSTDGTSIGTFVSTINGLTSGTTFYARAYATNSIGTRYGQPISFTTPTHCGTVTDYDGNIYQTVYIGAQCWMKENLKTTHYSNGAAITKGESSTNSYYPHGSNKYYYIYDDSLTIPASGLLYSWGAVMNGAGSSSNNPSGIQGICPSGWHVPSNAEWCEMENYIEPGIDVNCNSTGYRGSMAKKLAKPERWSDYQSNSFAPGYWYYDTTGFNTSGFSAIPNGRYEYYYSSTLSNRTAKYENLNLNAYWWTCTLLDNTYAYYRSMEYSNSGINLDNRRISASTGVNYYAFAVRCVKN